MGKPILWSADRVQTDENNRFVSDTNITNWNNKLENIIVTDWNNAINSGFYSALAGATNAPDSSVPLSGTIITSGNLIIQQLYPEDTSTEELIYYIRKGFKSGNNITWSKWFITNLYMEEVLTRIIKGYDSSSKKNLFNQLIPDTVTSIYFTDISMPSDATLIDVDDDGDGGVVAWLDTSDNTKMYVSTQYAGIKVEGNSNSTLIFSSASSNKSKLTSLDLSSFNTSKVTDMGDMFTNCNNLTSLDVSNFDTSNVTNMDSMFFNCSNLTSLNVSNFDTSNVTRMNYMFYNCNKLTTLDVSNWDTSNVTNMYDMFYICSKLTSLDLSNFNTSNVTNMGNMFSDCTNLTSLNISNFNTSKVTDMYQMFKNCTSLTSLDLSNFDTSNVTDMGDMFKGCSSLTSIKAGNNFKWTETLSGLGLGYDRYSYLYDVWKDEEDHEYAVHKYIQFPSNKPHTYTKIKKPLTYVLKGYRNSDRKNLFGYAIPDTVTSVVFTNNTLPKDGLISLIDVDDDGDYGAIAWTPSDDKSTMYVSTPTPGQKVIANQDSYVMFASCKTSRKITSIDVSNLDTSNVTNMSRMFTYLGVDKLDLSCLNTHSATTMESMIANNDSLISVDVSNFDTSNVTDMSFMFYINPKLTKLNLSNFNTSNVTNMEDMFSNCKKLVSVELSDWDTHNVTNMQAMFSGCTNLRSVNVSNWDTSSLTNMSVMFYGCAYLSTIDFSNWDTSKFTSKDYQNMVFTNCTSLKTIKVGNKFKWVSTLSQLGLSGTWQDETGKQYTSSSTFPSNVAHTYTKVS